MILEQKLEQLYKLFLCQNVHMGLTWVIDGMELVGYKVGPIWETLSPKCDIYLLPCGINMDYHLILPIFPQTHPTTHVGAATAGTWT